MSLETQFFALMMMRKFADPASDSPTPVVNALEKAYGQAFLKLKKQKTPPWYLLHMACALQDEQLARALGETCLRLFGKDPAVKAHAEVLIAHLERVSQEGLEETRAMLEDVGQDPEALWAAAEARRLREEAEGTQGASATAGEGGDAASG